MREFRRFAWPIALVLLAAIGIAYGISVWYGSGFWKEFAPGFAQTVLGLMVSATVGFSVWLLQQRKQKSLQRRQLLKDLKFEVKENLRRLSDLETYFGETAATGESNLRIQGLRTSIMKYTLNPTNVVILRDPDIEDEIDWLVKQCEEFDGILARGFEQYYVDLAAGMESEARAGLWKDISPHVEFIRILLKQVEEGLEKLSSAEFA